MQQSCLVTYVEIYVNVFEYPIVTIVHFYTLNSSVKFVFVKKVILTGVKLRQDVPSKSRSLLSASVCEHCYRGYIYDGRLDSIQTGNVFCHTCVFGLADLINLPPRRREQTNGTTIQRLSPVTPIKYISVRIPILGAYPWK